MRIVSTLRRLGIRSVAVYSDADEDARHVREADRSVRIGPASALASYLDVERILDAARATDAQAIHPGYGFLSENASFVRACEAAGLVFIGPSAAAVETMGDKIRAKLAVAAAGVPVVPGRATPGMTDPELVVAADEIGYPVLVKPSAGGGGKGMRLVTSSDDLGDALLSARREAASSFGDDTLFLERYVTTPRHIEVQVLADAHGTTLHLGERECSLQRRHQKVVEETPSTLLSAATRAAMAECAVRTARSVDYRGVGTVEFIVSADQPDDFFFMEMNTRLQVEHPVTEMVTGLDLVEQQLLVAAGEKLAFTQRDVRHVGHSIEARIYAEDPVRGFLPSSGPIVVLREPQGEGIRVDSSLTEGGEVLSHYDPMLAKVIAFGPDRSTALGRLDWALANTVVLGVATNTSFLRALLALPEVRRGDYDTGLIERDLAALVRHSLIDSALSSEVCAAFALGRLHSLVPRTPADRWDRADGWRLGEHAPRRWSLVTSDESVVDVSVVGTPERAIVRIDRCDPSGVVTTSRVEGAVRSASEDSDVEVYLTLDGQQLRAIVANHASTSWVWVNGTTYALRIRGHARRQRDALRGGGDVRSPMPGVVRAVYVTVDDAVDGGDRLAVVEAMKMEHTLVAPFSGHVSHVLVASGDQVAVDQLLVHVVANEDATPDSEEDAR